MSGRLGASWREGLADPLIREILDFAEDQKLDLSVTRDLMSPWYIQVEERVDPDYVKRLAKVIAHGWPESMPLPVVMGGATATIMDGSHRTTAARVAELEVIPVLAVNPDAYFDIMDKFGIQMFDYVHSILPAINPIMRENEQKDEQGGKPKKRSAEPWDMDAFGGTLSMGAAGSSGQAEAMALDLRNRILTLHNNRRELFSKEEWASRNRCLVDKTTPAAIARVARQLLPPTFTRGAELDAEGALIRQHGEGKYSNQILLRRHVNDTLLHFRILLLMNEILRSCGYGLTRPEDLLEQAAGRRAP